MPSENNRKYLIIPELLPFQLGWGGFFLTDDGISGGSRISRWGGRRPVGGGGGANLRRVHFSAKTKEIDPVGGARAAVPPWIRQWVYLNLYGVTGAGCLNEEGKVAWPKDIA